MPLYLQASLRNLILSLYVISCLLRQLRKSSEVEYSQVVVLKWLNDYSSLVFVDIACLQYFSEQQNLLSEYVCHCVECEIYLQQIVSVLNSNMCGGLAK